MAPASSPRPPRLLLLVVMMMMMMMMTDPAVPLPHARETPGRATEDEDEDDEEEEEEEEEGRASGTAARDFSCVLYDAAFLNCSWRPGRAAPRDVQYFLFTASHRDRRRERECPQYVTQEAAAAAPGGLHTGCHVRDLSAFGSLNYFRVNGSSAGGRGTIGVLYTRLSAKQIERFRPPGDVQVSCDASRCRASWSQPRTWVPLRFLDFHYQLRIRPKHAEDESDAGAQLVNVASPEERSFVFPSPAPRPRQEVPTRPPRPGPPPPPSTSRPYWAPSSPPWGSGSASPGRCPCWARSRASGTS